jgi:hypothetical protein
MQVPNLRYREDKSKNVQNNINARIRECMSLDIPTVTNVFHIPPIPEIAEWSAYKTCGNRKNNACHCIDENKSPKYASETLARKNA